MLVIEGSDCMGKTTLARQLWAHPQLQALGMEIQHLSKLPVGHDRSWHYVNRMNVDGIFDRFYLSEIAYAEARGDTDRPFTPEKIRWVHAQAVCRGVFTVLLTGDEGVIHGRWDKPEMYDKATVIRADAAFRKLEPLCDIRLHQEHSTHYADAEFVEFVVKTYLVRRLTCPQLR